MSTETWQLQKAMEDAFLGQIMVIPIEGENELNSTRVRLYRLRKEMKKRIPNIEEKISITQKGEIGKRVLILSPPISASIYKQDKEGNLIKVNYLKKTKDKEQERILRLMIKDAIPEEEVRAVVGGWSDSEEVLKRYYQIKEEGS